MPSPHTEATPPSRIPSGARAEAKRAAILAAAREGFLAHGFGVNLDRIAELADVSKVTIYNHFGNKETLFLTVIDVALSEALDDAQTYLTTVVADSTDLRADLITACRVWVTRIGSPELLQLRNAVVGELRQIPALATEWSKKGPERFHPMLAMALRSQVQRGRLSIPDIDLAVLQLSGLVLSPIQVYGAYGNPPTVKRVEQLITSGVDMFLSYYGYQDC
ncbi:TetR/AcrR family transcriptional regulator [Streptomyces sulfonofaciens]|uniref:TetR/AcrR family transcriptional regulator n=1 Tax=Streptomyces sulfonofaciens TaxID=68272 RepID=UPI001E502D36|nr:TetR/AcrR family transcriptional regulator [Streptomyces sulfonofaciens]